MELKSGVDTRAALLVMIGDTDLPSTGQAELEAATEHLLRGSAARLLPNLAPGTLELVRLGQQDAAVAKAPTSAAEARRLGVAVARCARTVRAGSVGVLGLESEFAGEVALGVQLGAYRFARYKPDETPELERLSIDTLSGDAARRSVSVAAGVQLARDLVNTPYNHLHAQDFSAVARTVAEASGLQIEVWGQAECEQRGMGLFAAVGQGSADEPQFIQLTYRPAQPSGEPRITALVGKGVMFDSGGYSLKPAAGMYGMKGDMGGAAAVLGAMQIVAALQPPHEVRAYIAATDNAVSGTAMRPGDIFSALNGKRVEVTNTDAEGRLILADALTLASQAGADEVIDIATLTGAKVTALGSDLAALFSNDRALAQAVRAAADSTQEAVWELPLHAPYLESYRSGVAELKNSDMVPAGGSVKAALFLQEFVTGPWAHLDIAGNALKEHEHPFGPAGATGYGAMLLAELAARP
ncbi:leucyl aminopeptidase family protein [Deinococcus ruber]|uniref:Leucyl aminopeptidase n=1 Tax=Deinococcus ruber TaxID=1848197 RepID=A0A918F5M7_9DEIO|nr:leucyl aminopeptidase family protein [Deinococcus ruber]GGR03139.1 leucyl aminopeptidase [Deinococcus ruber]